jgi:hypothetical protein
VHRPYEQAATLRNSSVSLRISAIHLVAGRPDGNANARVTGLRSTDTRPAPSAKPLPCRTVHTVFEGRWPVNRDHVTIG